MKLVTARRILCRPDQWIEDGGLLIEGGRIVRVLPSAAAVRRARRATDPLELGLGDCVLTPGLVNAHAHLDLTGLENALPRDLGFAAWVGALLRERSSRTPSALDGEVRRGALRCLETGTTTVGDIDSTGAGERSAARGPLRVRLYREVLDAWDSGRTAAALERIARALPPRKYRMEGVSPHAPFTTSRALLEGVARIVAKRSVPLSVHWSETRSEVDWLQHGSGELAAVLPASPETRGLELLDRVGLLQARTSLVHGNHPACGEPERIAETKSVLIHCPGTHAFFEREPFPLAVYRRAGVRLALGTDSLASNEDLDLRREMRLMRLAHPELTSGEVWAMGTIEAAWAVDLVDRVGALAPGHFADFVAFELEAVGLDDALEELTMGRGSVHGVWIGGRQWRGRAS